MAPVSGTCVAGITVLDARLIYRLSFNDSRSENNVAHHIPCVRDIILEFFPVVLLPCCRHDLDHSDDDAQFLFSANAVSLTRTVGGVTMYL